MAHILHISCDYQDSIAGRKTRAVNNLVAAADDFEHTVLSLNRSSRPGRSGLVRHDGNVFAMHFFALPFGLGLRYFLARLTRRLRCILRENDINPDIIHCHKLSYEGPLGRTLAAEIGIPYVLSIRGDTDLKLIRFKPTYRRWYRDTLAAADAVFFIAPWARAKISDMWPDSLPEHVRLLPNIVELAATGQHGSGTSTRLVCVAHLKEYRRKNISGLLQAVDACSDSNAELTLDIIGTGPEASLAAVHKLIQKMAHPGRVRLLGHLERNEIADRLPDYAALVLPSRRETFGMVYVEALQAGIPFLHSRNAGVDGYFTDLDVSIAVDPDSIRSIADGIALLLDSQDYFKTNIRELRDSGYLDQFSTAAVARTYTDTVNTVLATR